MTGRALNGSDEPADHVPTAFFRMTSDHTKPRFRPVPWIPLTSPQEVELWIDDHNRALAEHIGPQETGYGVCFTLAEGGNIYMQTTDDAVVLDVDAEAGWVAPLLEAVSRTEAPRGQLWVLPADKQVELIIGLSSLVQSTTLVAGHPFGARAGRRVWR
jgi:hypothetical protein